ncbi:MAG: DUF58 domain-containing protein [Betaproteobacteria bacterium]|nr:DUF58 domain-containing protein [Betaproteobacteria bacterium]
MLQGALQPLLQHSQLYNFVQWFYRRHAPEPGTIQLTQRRVYVLPSRQGVVFGISMVVMLIGSINYNLSLGYVLTFLLAGMGEVSILHTFRNLVRLRISPGRVDPVFAGELAQFHVHLENPDLHDRFSLALICKGRIVHCDVPARRVAAVSMPMRAEKRGWLALERITLETRFPLGLTRAWSYVRPDMRALVYPKPDDALLPLPQARPKSGDAISVGAGTDDFFGLRAYQPSDSPRHVAWKASARTDTPLTKVFTGRASSELWFDFDDLPRDFDTKARLSRLTRWVLLATQGRTRYGLRLPGTEVPLGEGEAQREACLRALALFET